MRSNHITITLLLVFCFFGACKDNADKETPFKEEQKGTSQSIPQLRKKGEATQLIVDDKPYLILGGELHNSSSSNVNYIQNIWPKLDTMGLNTVLAAVTWDLFEPEEGMYDFSLLDALIQQARKYEMKLVVLWFGSWKNGISHYAPDWVKVDQKRFPRVRIYNGKSLEILSPLSKATLEADTRAYVAMVKHIKEIDAVDHTVVMIQMQNEVGVLGDSRDRSDAANQAFASQVPVTLIGHLQKNRNELLPELKKVWENAGSKTAGTWQEVFGKGFASDEIFMAWSYAQFMNHMTQAGKKEYALPVFVNAWIVQPEDKKPGDYPSGGPQAHMHDVWRAAAPDIDILAPDIYLPNFGEVCDQYTRNNNTLFVPESRAGEEGAGNAFYAFGNGKAIGYSPFGIDNRIEDAENGPIPKAYKLLAEISPLILEAQSKGTIAGVSLNQEYNSKEIKLGGYRLNVELKRSRRQTTTPDRGYGLIISTGPEQFMIAGKNIQITFFPDTPGPAMAGIASLYEGKFEKGEWIPGRKLNGDNIMLDYHLDQQAASNKTGSVVRTQGNAPEILKLKLYRFE